MAASLIGLTKIALALKYLMGHINNIIRGILK